MVLHEMYDGLMIMDFFDDCIIGVVKGMDNEDKVCYSYRKVIAKLMREDDMTAEDAVEHFYYNMMGAYVGKHTPVFLFKEDD
tara:strand:+ start:165 stop:410 length:246 start_codon:yes stop_codon:yes gene_type:complete